MDIRQILSDVRRNWIVALVVFLVCAGAGYVFATVPAKQYTATTTLVAYPTPGTADPVGAVAVIQYVLPLIPAEATNPDTLTSARRRVPASMSGAHVSIASLLEAGTGVVTISATSGQPGVAAAYATSVAKQVTSEQQSTATYQLTTLSRAIPPSSPSNPPLPIVVGAFGLGLILAVFAALAAAGVRRRLSRVTEVRDRIGAAVIGQIPRMRRDIKPAELFVPGAHNMEVEAFQELRSNLLISLPSDRRASIAVTSCDPSEGKTSVAANIAWALASPDLAVTAVDCDVRRPMLHLRFGVPFGPGIAGGSVAYALERTWRTPNPNLGVIPAGISDRHPADIVSAHLPGMLDELRKKNQTVVVDCPPVIGVAETVLIASLVDVVLVVVDARRFRPERLQQSLARLEDAGATIGGVVLNRVRFGRRKRSAAYGYGYGYSPKQRVDLAIERRNQVQSGPRAMAGARAAPAPSAAPSQAPAPPTPPSQATRSGPSASRRAPAPRGEATLTSAPAPSASPPGAPPASSGSSGYWSGRGETSHGANGGGKGAPADEGTNEAPRPAPQ